MRSSLKGLCPSYVTNSPSYREYISILQRRMERWIKGVRLINNIHWGIDSTYRDYVTIQRLELR